VTLAIHASDPIVHAGLLVQLSASDSFRIVELEGVPAQVTVVATDAVDDEVLATVVTAEHDGSRALVILRDLEDRRLAELLDAGAHSLLRHSEAKPDRLAAMILTTASGDAAIPADVLHYLLGEVRAAEDARQGARGPKSTAITDREAQVLLLVAEGYDTADIAGQLFYSERTVKNIIHDVVARHQLRNRTHAAAHAIRQGWI